MKNPYKNAKSVNDFFKILRKHLEKIQRSRFRSWKVLSWFESQNDIIFEIETTGVVRHLGFSKGWWYDLIDHDDGIICASTGNSGSAPGTLRGMARINLKHLPRVKKLFDKNAVLMHKREMLFHTDRTLLEIRNNIQQLEMMEKERTMALEAAYDRAHLQINPSTGKPIPYEGQPEG